MRPHQFEYKRPQSLEEALRVLSENPEYRPLAGGHSLIPAMNLRLAQPEGLLDLGRLEVLRGVRFDEGQLRIGALTTHAQVAASPDVQKHCPALSDAASVIGDPQVRAWGTLGGNLAHADPASDPPPVIVACEGTIRLASHNGSRDVAAEDFFVDIFTTAALEGELLTEIIIPSQAGRKSAYLKLPHPASRYPVVGVCVVLDWDGVSCARTRVAIGGATGKATRCQQAEGVLTGSDLGEQALRDAGQAISAELGEDLLADHYASAEYRRAMAGVFLKRSVKAALG